MILTPDEMLDLFLEYQQDKGETHKNYKDWTDIIKVPISIDGYTNYLIEKGFISRGNIRFFHERNNLDYESVKEYIRSLIQEHNILAGAKGDTPASAWKFIMQNQHKWTEKQEVITGNIDLNPFMQMETEELLALVERVDVDGSKDN